MVGVARVVVPCALAIALLRSDLKIKFFVGFGLVSIAPFLLFTFEPTSRYTYLSAAGFAPVLAAGVLWLGSRLASVRIPSGTLGVVAGTLLTLLALANTMIIDNDYEYRERAELTLVADVQTNLTVLPVDHIVRITGLPRFGVDPGIHLEAALRLAYGEPELRLQIVPDEDSSSESLLRFESGRILKVD